MEVGAEAAMGEMFVVVVVVVAVVALVVVGVEEEVVDDAIEGEKEWAGGRGKPNGRLRYGVWTEAGRRERSVADTRRLGI